MEDQRLQARHPYLWAGLLTLLIAATWLLPGYVFGTDWPGPRRFDVPTELSSAAAFQVALAAMGAILTAQVASKLVILGCLALAALTAYRALPVGRFVTRAMAAAVFVVNPFVFGRLHYGQLGLLLAYALLPWLATASRTLVRRPRMPSAVRVALGLTVIGILDLHMLIPAGLVLAAIVVAYAAWRWQEVAYLRRLAASLAAAVGATILASAYWLIPLLTSGSQQGRTLAGIGPADLEAFRTASDPNLGLLPNVLGLYGFWAENTGRFTSMKAFAPLWPFVLLVFLALATVGAKGAWQRRPEIAFPDGRPWVLALLGAGLIGLILEMGVAEPHIAPVIRWLDSTFPPYRGMRDAGKWAALLALVYAQLIPLGAMVVLAWLRAHVRPPRFELAEALAAGLLLALPIYFGNGLLFGMHGEVRPSEYPAGWYAADRMLAADAHPGRALFLPWHLYLRLSFVRNQNDIVASPAPSFFSVPMVVSTDPEIEGITAPSTADQRLGTDLLAAGASGSWGSTLAARNVKYLVLAREADWHRYGYLANRLDLQLVGDFGSIVVYRNLLWRPTGT